jgi:hypothetical protein
MNVPILIAGVLSLVAFIAHAFQGDKEVLMLKPEETDSKIKKQSWVQTRSGWHWVSVDLLFSSILLILISTTEFIENKSSIAQLLSVYFLLTGVVWFITVLFSKNNRKQIFTVGQWIFCFIMSGLIYYGLGNL